MKDKNGIEKNCSNCRYYEVCASNEVCEKYTITIKAYEARIAELQKELNVVQESERAEAQEADRLRGEVQNLKKENERLSKEIIDLGAGTLAEKNYQLATKQCGSCWVLHSDSNIV